MLTSVLQIPTRVTITQTVLIPRVPTAVGANQGLLEMEHLAKVVYFTRKFNCYFGVGCFFCILVRNSHKTDARRTVCWDRGFSLTRQA